MSGADDSGFHVGSILDGRYRIDGILGRGGMGRVYRGQHTGIGKPVAIKVLRADLGREAAQRFQREALASGRLDHINIVGVSDFCVIEDGPCYLVMEALEGESLGDRLQREKRIPWPEAFAILRGVLAGLNHAHERGVVHRDIKPDNIFLAQKDGEVIIKILDFGIAKLAAGTADDPAATSAGLTVGTPAYLSPEQAVGGEITPACDLYSTTIVLYEMLTGRAPFEDQDQLAMLGAHVGRPPPPLAEIAPELALPPGLEELVQKGLAKRTVDRIPNATEYFEMLEQIAPAPAPPPRMRTSPVALPTPYAGTPVVLATAPTSNLTPVPASATPFPEAVAAAKPVLPPAPASEIPRKWIAIAAVVLVGVLILTIVMFATKGNTGDKPGPVPAPEPPPNPRDAILDQWRIRGLVLSPFVPKALPAIGGDCATGTVAGVEVALCTFADAAAAKSAEAAGLVWVGETTGISTSRGMVLVVAADRKKADVHGKTINAMMKALPRDKH